MDLVKFIQENEIPVVVIPEDRVYWLIRTQSGEYYDDFYHDDFIGIGWNEFSDINKLKNTAKEVIIEEMKQIYRNEEDEKKQPQHGRIYGSIQRFLFELKVGDIVMIPSSNSSRISFGVVASEPFLKTITQSELDEGQCPFIKRRKVKWLKTVQRDQLDPYLYRMMQTHQAISNASDYSDNIDRTMYNFYMKGSSAHLVVDVKQDKQIPALDIINYVNSVLDIVPFIENPDNPDEEFSKEQIDLKLSIQSPGILDFFTTNAPYIILALGIVVIGFMGGKVKMKNKTKVGEEANQESEFELQSEGFMEKYLKIAKHNDEQKLKLLERQHKIYMDRLKAELPKDVVNKKSDQE